MAAKTLSGVLTILIAMAGVSSPLDGRGAPLLLKGSSEKAQADDQSDDDLLVLDSPFLLPRRSAVDGDGNWVKFHTDECGVPDQVQSARSMLRQSAFDNEMDDPGDDEMDELGGDDPADQAWGVISDWLSAEPEIAVVNDGVDTACDDFPALFDDSEPEIIADWTPPTSRANGREPGGQALIITGVPSLVTA